MKPVSDRGHAAHPRAQRQPCRLPGARAGRHRSPARRRPHGLRQRRARLRRLPANDKLRVVAERAPNIGVVTAYNDMLSAHQPYEGLPAVIRDEARKPQRHHAGGRRRAGDVRRRDAGLPGMELSLFSRDTIAMGTGDRADARRVRRRAAARHLRQDRAGPADRRAALRPSALRVRAGWADEQRSVEHRKAKVREQFAQGLVGREAARAESGLSLTAPAPAPSTAPPTATRCCSRPWACTCPARPSCTRTRGCARR